jgi:hypothetical protein
MNTAIFLFCIVFPILMLPAVAAVDQITWRNALDYLVTLHPDPKTAILLFFALVFLAVQTYFLVRNNRRTEQTGILEAIYKYGDIKAYSKFLSNYAENIALNAVSANTKSAI